MPLLQQRVYLRRAVAGAILWALIGIIQLLWYFLTGAYCGPYQSLLASPLAPVDIYIIYLYLFTTEAYTQVLSFTTLVIILVVFSVAARFAHNGLLYHQAYASLTFLTTTAFVLCLVQSTNTWACFGYSCNTHTYNLVLQQHVYSATHTVSVLLLFFFVTISLVFSNQLRVLNNSTSGVAVSSYLIVFSASLFFGGLWSLYNDLSLFFWNWDFIEIFYIENLATVTAMLHLKYRTGRSMLAFFHSLVFIRIFRMSFLSSKHHLAGSSLDIVSPGIFCSLNFSDVGAANVLYFLVCKQTYWYFFLIFCAMLVFLTTRSRHPSFQTSNLVSVHHRQSRQTLFLNLALLAPYHTAMYLYVASRICHINLNFASYAITITKCLFFFLLCCFTLIAILFFTNTKPGSRLFLYARRVAYLFALFTPISLLWPFYTIHASLPAYLIFILASRRMLLIRDVVTTHVGAILPLLLLTSSLWFCNLTLQLTIQPAYAGYTTAYRLDTSNLKLILDNANTEPLLALNGALSWHVGSFFTKDNSVFTASTPLAVFWYVTLITRLYLISNHEQLCVFTKYSVPASPLSAGTWLTLR